jgi:5-methylcytosine-specific restriction endonuclease McrA
MAWTQEQRAEDRRWRRQVLVVILGGACAVCGTTEHLEFDHVDPRRKSFNIAIRLSAPWRVLFNELDKCQLLCARHHREKTRRDLQVLMRGPHRRPATDDAPGVDTQARKRAIRRAEVAAAWAAFRPGYCPPGASGA